MQSTELGATNLFKLQTTWYELNATRTGSKTSSWFGIDIKYPAGQQVHECVAVPLHCTVCWLKWLIISEDSADATDVVGTATSYCP